MNELRKCQILQLNIANEVIKICEKNNISYIFIAGSMLGTIRHKGFIPWDDDLDIGMMRSEYKKFLKIAKNELPSNLFLQTWDTDTNFGLPITKIRLNGTKYIEKNSRNVEIHSGIYIDIFPFDNVPENEILMRAQRLGVTFFKHLLLNKCNYEYIDRSNKRKWFIGRIFKILSKFVSFSYIHKRFYSIMTKYNNNITKCVVAFGGASNLKKETLNRSWVIETEIRDFEGLKVNISREWDAYLKHFYGDYMTPPPENDRYIGHSITEIDFGKSLLAEGTNK